MSPLVTAYLNRRACGNAPRPALRLAREDVARGYTCTPRKSDPALLGHGDVLRTRDASGRHTYVVAIVHDSDMGPPWEEHDGHGPVSDQFYHAPGQGVKPPKRAGELILHWDGYYRKYDFAEACKIALRDGWDAAPYGVPGETKRQRATRAARADFEHLRRWCADEWHWCGVCLFELPRDGVERNPQTVADAALGYGGLSPFTEYPNAALWGIESDSPEYHDEVARELIGEVS